MEYRKLISFGKSSYVVSLPKSWVTHNKLKKGDLIYFDEQNSSLIVKSAENKEVPEVKSIVIDVSGKDLLQIRREMNASYIENCREITLKGKDLKEKSEEILKFVRDLIALEVIELDATKIVTRDFLDIDKVSMQELVKKMDMTVRSMIKDSTHSFSENNAENIALRDHDVNRLSFLLYRVIRYGLRNQPQTLKNFSLNSIDLLNLYWVTFHLESIADEAKRISRAMCAVTLAKPQQSEFVSLLKRAEEFYLEMMKSYYQNDRTRAFELSNQKMPLIKTVNAFFESFKEGGKEVSYLTDRFRRLISSIHELDRLTYQY